MITTILLFELTVAGHQRVTVKNRCLYLVTSLGSPDTEREKVEAKRLAGTLKRKWGLLPVSGNRKEKKVVVGQGLWQTEPKPVLRVEEDKKYLGHEGAKFFKPVLKIA